MVDGGRTLIDKVRQFRPAWLAVLGIGAYRTAFGRKNVHIGPQADAVGDTGVWVLPNPSGLNAHFQLPDLAAQFALLREVADDQDRRPRPATEDPPPTTGTATHDRPPTDQPGAAGPAGINRDQPAKA
jgi:TDG/mug DNA glycosylase family protein